MPIAPSPHLYHCRACHWFKVVTHASDALVLGVNHFNHCPACGSKDIERRACPSLITHVARWLQRQGFRPKS